MQSQTPNAPSGWKQTITDWVQFLRTLLVNGVIIGAILAIIVFAVRDVWRQPVIIEAFSLPEALSARGYSGAVTAQRVWDAMTAIQAEAGTLKQTQSLLAESRQLDVVEPGTGLSLRSVTSMLRSLAGIEQTRIAGEVICDDGACDWDDLRLRLRVFADGRMYIINVVPGGDDDVERLFRDAALRALEIIDPYIYAAYHFSTGPDGYTTATGIANTLVDTGHPQSAWAANLLGNHAQSTGDHEGAIVWFEKAARIAIDKGPTRFALPDYGRGNSLLALERHDEALLAYEKAIGLDGQYASPHFGKGQVLMTLGDYDNAARAFRRASELDRSDAAHWAGLGDAMTRLEAKDEAIEHLGRAVRLNAGFAPARYALARLLIESEAFAAAIRHLKIAVEIEPDRPVYFDALASAHRGAGDDDAADATIQKAAKMRLKQVGVFGSNLLAGLRSMRPDQ